MSSRVMARMQRRAAFPPVWTSVLVVTAHPDATSSGLGAVLDAFMFAGARIEVLCLTHGEVWTLADAPGDLAMLRGAELASAADVLAPISTKMADHENGPLGELCQTKLAAEVVAVADACHPDGLLVFDPSAVGCPLDHVAATSAGLLAGETLDLPVLGWSLSESAVAQLSREFGTGAVGRQSEQVDLRVTLDRARQRLASRENVPRPSPGSIQWSRLELLAETQSLRWLRPPGAVTSHPQIRTRRPDQVSRSPTEGPGAQTA